MDQPAARKFLYITLGITACIIALSVFLIIKKRDQKLALTTPAAPDVISAEDDAKLDEQIKKALDSIDFENFDTDKDGVPDWQENIYGLNPASAQTYGEGTSDKAFVENVQTSKKNENLNIKQTKTDLFAKDLYKISSGLKEGQNINDVSNNLADSIKNTQVSKVYKKTDIIYASDYRQSYVKYISIVYPFLGSAAITNEDLDSISNAKNEEESIERILQLKEKIFSFEKVILATMPPKGWLDEHISFLNTTVDLRTKLYLTVNQSIDPINSLAAMTSLNNAVEKYNKEYKTFVSMMLMWSRSQ